MTAQIRQIAERIKALREISDYSEEEAAKRLSIPVPLYISYESGEMDIPLSFMYSVSSLFKVDLNAILTGVDARLHQYSLVRKGTGTKVERRQQYQYESLAFNFSGAKMEPFVVTVEPKADEAIVLSSHTGQELDYLLEGKLKIVINGYEVILTEGDSVYFDSSHPHGMAALDGKPAKFLAVIL